MRAFDWLENRCQNAWFDGFAIAVSSDNFFQTVFLQFFECDLFREFKKVYDNKACWISAGIKNRCRTDLACCEARGWCHSGCWPPYLPIKPSAPSTLSPASPTWKCGRRAGAGGDDDRLVPGVQGDAGAVLLLRLITILEVRMRTSPSLAGGSGWDCVDSGSWVKFRESQKGTRHSWQNLKSLISCVGWFYTFVTQVSSLNLGLINWSHWSDCTRGG